MSYIYPTSVRTVTDSFAAHVARGSVNPGTDYACAMGTPVVSVSAGRVTDADGTPGGSGGRMIHVDHDDGSGADYLHLNALSVSAGDRVTQGQRIGYSGASGVPDPHHPPADLNHGYGPHLHISFRRNHAHGYSNVGNVDFDAIMRGQTASAGGDSKPIAPTTRNEDDDMKLIRDPKSGTIAAVGAGRYFPFGSGTGTTLDSAGAVAKVWGPFVELATHEEFLENVHAAGGDQTNISKPYPA